MQLLKKCYGNTCYLMQNNRAGVAVGKHASNSAASTNMFDSFFSDASTRQRTIKTLCVSCLESRKCNKCSQKMPESLCRDTVEPVCHYLFV